VVKCNEIGALYIDSKWLMGTYWSHCKIVNWFVMNSLSCNKLMSYYEILVKWETCVWQYNVDVVDANILIYSFLKLKIKWYWKLEMLYQWGSFPKVPKFVVGILVIMDYITYILRNTRNYAFHYGLFWRKQYLGISLKWLRRTIEKPVRIMHHSCIWTG